MHDRTGYRVIASRTAGTISVVSVPQRREPRVAVEPAADQRGEPLVTGIPSRGTTQVGDDRTVGRLVVLRHDRPVSQAAGRVSVGREPGPDQVAALGREGGRVTEQGRPAAIPPDQPPVGREHRDRRLAQPGELTKSVQMRLAAR
jgi:hypothetical protein